MKSIKELTFFLVIFFIPFIGIFNIYAQQEQTDLSDFQKEYTGLRLIGQEDKKSFIFEYRADPGAVITGKFKAVHDFQEENTARQFFLMASDFVVNSTTAEVVYPGRSLRTDGKYALAEHITFSKDSFILEKWGDEEIIEFTITVPTDINPGTYYAALLVSSISQQQYETGDPELGNAAGAAISTRLAPVVFLTVNGDLYADIDATLEVMTSVEGEPFLGLHEYLPVLFKAQLSNEGNYYINPSGNLFIHRGDETKPVKTFKFNEDANRLLPESARPFYNLWDESLFLYKQVNSSLINGYVTVAPDKSHSLRLGKYYATLKIAYRNPEGEIEVITRSSSFWVVPWKLLVVLGASIIVMSYISIKKFLDTRLR
jgi:hypothetical protein